MRITILLFGILRDVVGENSLIKKLETGTTVHDLRQELMETYDGITQYKNYSIAVNEGYVDNNYVIKENDVVALIPPVSGG